MIASPPHAMSQLACFGNVQETEAWELNCKCTKRDVKLEERSYAVLALRGDSEDAQTRRLESVGRHDDTDGRPARCFAPLQQA